MELSKKIKRIFISIAILVFTLVLFYSFLGRISLFSAIESDNTIIVQSLLNVGIDPNSLYVIRTSYHSGTAYGSALSRATDKGNLEMVDLLMRNGATLYAGKPRHSRPRSPLISALQQHNLDIVEFFINKADDETKRSYINRSLYFLTSQAKQDEVSLNSDSSCKKLIHELGNQDYLSLRRKKSVKMFLRIAEKYANNDQLMRIYEKNEVILNQVIIDYLISRKVYPERKEVISRYLVFPSITKSFISGGYNLPEFIEGHRFCTK